MYNFAVVVDDYDMQISHVLRGEEHISNTPYQIAIKEALGFQTQPIEYGHLSIIVDETGKKLSKRNSALKQFIDDYKQMGFLPEAVTNFLALLGWSNKDNSEILSMSDIIKNFDVNRISKAPAFFDFKKMLWIGNQYIKKMNEAEYLEFVHQFLDIPVTAFRSVDARKIALLLFQPQLSYGVEINDLIKNTFLSTNFANISNELKTIVTTDTFNKCIESFKQVLSTYDDITLDNGNEIVNKVKVATGLKGKELYLPIRFIAIAKEHGPEMNKILAIVGKETILKNIQAFKQIVF
jgi:glutamyl-tRNA synthetase